MKILQIPAYTIDELSPSARQTVLDREREYGPFPDWSEMTLEEARVFFAAQGIDLYNNDAPAIEYDLDGQGSGARIRARITLDALLDTDPDLYHVTREAYPTQSLFALMRGPFVDTLQPSTLKTLRRLRKADPDTRIEAWTTATNHRYFHEHTLSTDIDCYDPSGPRHATAGRRFTEAAEEIEAKFLKYVKEASRAVFRLLHDEYATITSDEYLIEEIEERFEDAPCRYSEDGDYIYHLAGNVVAIYGRPAAGNNGSTTEKEEI